MAVRSKALALSPTNQLPTAVTTAVTAASDETVLVKRVTLYNRSAGTVSASCYINDGSGARRVLRLNLATTESVDHETWWVLQPGWTLQWNAAVANAIEASVHGAELEGVAD